MKIFIIALAFVLVLKSTDGWPLSKENRFGTISQIQKAENIQKQVLRILFKTPEKIDKV
jgi:hypothetical protein